MVKTGMEKGHRQAVVGGVASGLPKLTAPLPQHIDIAIVGAGPHALTLVTHLLQKRRQ